MPSLNPCFPRSTRQVKPTGPLRADAKEPYIPPYIPLPWGCCSRGEELDGRFSAVFVKVAARANTALRGVILFPFTNRVCSGAFRAVRSAGSKESRFPFCEATEVPKSNSPKRVITPGSRSARRTRARAVLPVRKELGSCGSGGPRDCGARNAGLCRGRRGGGHRPARRFPGGGHRTVTEGAGARVAVGWRVRHLPEPAPLTAGAGGDGHEGVLRRDRDPLAPSPVRARGGRGVELKPPSSPSANGQRRRPPPANESAEPPATSQ